MKCPQCQTEAGQVGNFWICPTHGQLAGPKPPEADGVQSGAVLPSSVCLPPSLAPLRIFLSYGHDANEELVRRIKTDLENRGHDVWFDKNEIKAGDEWRRSITDGILKSNRVLSFLSKHSTRDPGVCRDEIAIAIGVKGGNIQTILVESEQEVQPPVNIGHIQWLDMHDWKERRAAGEAVWEPWYQAKLAEIVRVVESDESRRFAGEIETLSGHLKPIGSEPRICQLLSKGFYGRQWLFEAVEKWRLGVPPSGGPAPRELANRHSPLATSHSRLFWIMGAPGVGKSTFAAQLTHTRGDTVVAAQFCEWDKPDHRNAARVVRSLAFQLATRLPDYRKLLLTLPEIAELDRKDPAELFDYLLANPLRSVIHGGRDRYLIVIDALDEAGEAGRNPLVEMLARNAQRLPDWVGFVVTSRPESAVKTPLQGLNPSVLDTRTEANRADLRDYLRHELAPQLKDRPDADRLVEQILEKSEGVFLYVERFCDDVQHNHLSLEHPEQFPQGLGGIFCQWFQRQFPDLEEFRKDVRPALRAILAAREPLPVEILQRLFNWREEELRDFTRPLASLFPVTGESGHEVIKPYHKSLADWLGDESKAGPYFVSVAEGHRSLAELCWRHYQEGVKTMSPYVLAHLLSHLLTTSRWEEAESALLHLPYLEARVSAGQAFTLADDFTTAVEALPPVRAERHRLRLLDEALRRDLHFIARHVQDYPQALFQCMWNSAWWYDCPQVATHYQVPEGGWKEAPVWERLIAEQKLSTLLDRWRSQWETAHPTVPWLRTLRPPFVHLGAGQIAILRGHEGPVNSVAISPDGRRLLTGSSDRTLRLWNANNGQEVEILRGHEREVNSVAFSPDSDWVVSGSDDMTVRLWDAHSGREMTVLRGHKNWVRSVAFSPDGRRVLSGSDDQTVRLWDADGKQEQAILRGHQGIVYSVAFSPDGRRVLSGSYDNTVRLWDAESGRQLAVLHGHENTVRGGAFSPDGRRVLSASYDNTVRLWDAESGRQLAVLHGHEHWATCVAFSPDGRRVLNGSKDHTALLWNAQGGRELNVLRGPEGYIVNVAFSPDGRRVMSRDEFGKLLVWNLQSVQCLNPMPTDGLAFAGNRSGSADRRASVENGETLVRLRPGVEPVARFPAPLHDLQAHPDGRTWAGGVNSHLVLLRLDGVGKTDQTARL